MPEPPTSMVATVTVIGDTYDELTAAADKVAAALLGDRKYHLALTDVRPMIATLSGPVSRWNGVARITYPIDPMF